MCHQENDKENIKKTWQGVKEWKKNWRIKILVDMINIKRYKKYINYYYRYINKLINDLYMKQKSEKWAILHFYTQKYTF